MPEISTDDAADACADAAGGSTAGGEARRPLTSRDTTWARQTAAWLTRRGVTPNGISVASVGFATAAGACLALAGRQADWPRAGLLVAGAVLVQGRLLCNLFDGMVAVEGGKGTPTGAIYNELPDRLADPLILVGAGYGLWLWEAGPALGWAAGAVAILTAYVRALGASLGAGQDFSGPMAKPQRMATITVAALLSALEPLVGAPRGVTMLVALGLVVLGGAWTVARRARRLAATLNARAAGGTSGSAAGAAASGGEA